MGYVAIGVFIFLLFGRDALSAAVSVFFVVVVGLYALIKGIELLHNLIEWWQWRKVNNYSDNDPK